MSFFLFTGMASMAASDKKSGIHLFLLNDVLQFSLIACTYFRLNTGKNRELLRLKQIFLFSNTYIRKPCIRPANYLL